MHASFPYKLFHVIPALGQNLGRGTSRLPKQSCCDIPHVCFLELVILSIVPVDVHEVEGIYYSVHVEAHVDESVDKVLVISLVSKF